MIVCIETHFCVLINTDIVCNLQLTVFLTMHCAMYQDSYTISEFS